MCVPDHPSSGVGVCVCTDCSAGGCPVIHWRVGTTFEDLKVSGSCRVWLTLHFRWGQKLSGCPTGLFTRGGRHCVQLTTPITKPTQL